MISSGSSSDAHSEKVLMGTTSYGKLSQSALTHWTEILEGDKIDAKFSRILVLREQIMKDWLEIPNKKEMAPRT